MIHRISVSCVIPKIQSDDPVFSAKTQWLSENGYGYSGDSRYWTKFTESREKAFEDLWKIMAWPKWAVFITPVNRGSAL